jgi:hypothetical protein
LWHHARHSQQDIKIGIGIVAQLGGVSYLSEAIGNLRVGLVGWDVQMPSKPDRIRLLRNAKGHILGSEEMAHGVLYFVSGTL